MPSLRQPFLLAPAVFRPSTMGGKMVLLARTDDRDVIMASLNVIVIIQDITLVSVRLRLIMYIRLIQTLFMLIH